MAQPQASNSPGGAAHRLDGFLGALLTANSHEELFQALCGLGRETAGAFGVAVLTRQQGSVRVVTASPPLPQGGEAPSWLVDLAKSYGQMLAENRQTVPLGGGAYGVFVPLLTNEHGTLTLAAHVLGGRQVRLQSVGDILQLVRASLFLVDRVAQNGVEQAKSPERAAPENSLLDVVDIVSEVQACTRFFEAATTLCAETAGKFDCRRAALGSARNGRVRATALDQMESFARGTRSVRQIEEVMQEALDQDRMVLFSAVPGEEGEPGVIARAARELALASHARRVLSLPLRTQDGAARFVLTLVLDGEEFGPRQLDALALVCRLAAPRLRDLQLAEEMPLKKLWRYFMLRSADIFGPRRTGLKLTAALLGAGLAATLLISSPIEVSAPLTIEGVHSYTHTAPMDSYLHEVLARPGDEVKSGDVLGRLDATEINLEIAALEAQGHIHESQADQYLQEGKDAEAAIARLEAERTRANLAWASRRLAMTELTSSVDGFIISEDMFPRLGQPVRRGQELFEVTDTASLRIVVHVGESDISDINRALGGGEVRGEFTLTAYPDVRVPFTVERVHPYATVAEDGNGFEVRGRIDAAPGGLTLRPGMEGHARIAAGETSVLDVWTRKLVNRARLIVWRWF